MKKILLFCCLLFATHVLTSQEYFPKNDGVHQANDNFTAFTNAKIYISASQYIEGGTLLIRDGKIVEVGKSVTVPPNSVSIDLNGKSVYPSFIDIYSDLGLVKPQPTGRRGRSAQYDPTRSGYYWNDHIITDYNAVENFKFDSKKAEELRAAGFGTVNTHRPDGVARGTSTLVTLNAETNDNERILARKAAQHYSFTRSVASDQAYPSSIMGTLALLRQMYHDAEWYSKGNSNTKDLALEALIANRGLVSIIEANDKWNGLRADKVGDLFNLQYVIVGGGYEYENIAEVKATNATFILPLNFPDSYDVTNPYQSVLVSLADMRKWNQAPGNPLVFEQNNIPFAFTTKQLKSPKEMLPKIRKAIEYGLSPQKALEALTTVPASILKRSDEIGTLKKGAYANFLITSGDLFDKKTTIFENWIQGKRNSLENMQQKDIRGVYDLFVAGTTYKLSISGEFGKPKAEVKKDTVKLKSTLSYVQNWLDLTITSEEKETFRMTAIISDMTDNFAGKSILPNGTESTFSATKTGEIEDSEEKEKEDDETPVKVVPVTYPNMAYGNINRPQQENILFRNATVWTGEDAGILAETDVLIKNGKISRIGKNLSASGARVVDATGKHLTAGIIDEHSHIALSSVNEGGHNSSAEVKMEDVVDPDDIGIYRALAGGVTSAHLLHGSANPIGGQSAIIKLKWGETADNMIYSNSPKFIKFALGENVKQSNWGAVETVRFPQTRMGVEQVYYDYFQRAREYETKKKSGKPFRYDEEMETLVEILNGDRFISCHSYVQSEINMLMKVAEEFGVVINTFTHILEGYKVADKMKQHGTKGVSTFSDWWAFKFEVNDAIPYNAAIMFDENLNVGINSDDGEMIRRLNQEAAKTIKYGNVPEYEAWKMVTINPAKMLHLDERVGSIKEGKDADVVLWNDHPLSVYSKAETTVIDGAVYFDIEKDKQARDIIKRERNELINLMLGNKKNGGDTQEPKQLEARDFHCDTDHLLEFHSH